MEARLPDKRTADDRREYLRAYRARPENKAKELARSRERLSQMKSDPERRKKNTEYQKEYRAKNPDKVRAASVRYNERNRAKRREQYRNYGFKKLYGIALEERDALLAAQGFRCAACGREKQGGRRWWHVDHCHRDGQVRGILCTNCNVALGHVNDDIEHLNKLIRYIERANAHNQLHGSSDLCAVHEEQRVHESDRGASGLGQDDGVPV